MEISQTELIEQVRQRGFSLSLRTLRYWSARGLIPRPKRASKAYYSTGIVDAVCALCASQPKRLSERKGIIETLHFPGFGPMEVIETLSTVTEDGRVKIYRRLRDGRVVIQFKRRALEGGISE